MTMFVTVDEAQNHLFDYNDENVNDITLKIHAASGAVRNYLGSAADVYFDDETGDLIQDENGVNTVPFEVKAATLILLGHLYKDRDGDPDKQWTPGYLPAAVVSLLYPLRDPVIV
jgi:hypothetical protein